MPRKILALYKSSEGRSTEANEIYRLAQLPLNNLGLAVEYADAEGDLPAPEEMAAYRGVLTWFSSDQMKNARGYRTWLRRVLRRGIRVVIVGHMGAYREWQEEVEWQDTRETQEIFRLLGMATNLRTWIAEDVVFVEKDSQFYDYETELRPDHFRYVSDVRSIDPENRVLLSIMQSGVRNDAAVLSRRGGYLQTDAIHLMDEASGRAQWLIDPFAFFRIAFDTHRLPVADINMVGGRRVAFIHIDGDGFSTISKIDRWHLCAQLLQSRVLKKFPLPFSVSVITAEVDTAYFGNLETLHTAQKLFRLPNVEPASHSFSHPLDWRSGRVSFDSIPAYRFDAGREITGSMHHIQELLLPPEKTISLFFWSGASNPTADQIRQVEQHGWLQINGGGGSLDPERPSISAFAPAYAQIGDQVRVNARSCNEFEFTNGWTGPYDGFEHVIASFEFTETRGPLTPADIYFHPYIMEFDDGWKSLRHVLQWVRHRNWTFLYTSQYVRMVQDFLDAEIRQLSADHYVVLTNGDLRTIRFPGENRGVDLSASRNVLGFTYNGGDLLVHLDARRRHDIVLGSGRERLPYLVEANRWVDSLSVVGDTVTVAVSGYGDFVATLADLLPESTYEVVAVSGTGEGEVSGWSRLFTERQVVRTGGDGLLTLNAFVTNRARLILKPVGGFAYVLRKVRLWLLGTLLLGFVAYQLKRTKAQPNGVDR